MARRRTVLDDLPLKQIATAKEVCIKYDINHKKLTATIAKCKDFPVLHVSTGVNDPYQFDLVEIAHWLDHNDWYAGDRLPAGRPRKKHGSQLETYKAAQIETNSKAKIQTALLEIELNKKKGLLIDREEVVQFFSMKIARLAKQLELLPNLIGKKLNFSDEAIRQFRDHLDQARLAMVNDDEGFFNPPAEESKK